MAQSTAWKEAVFLLKEKQARRESYSEVIRNSSRASILNTQATIPFSRFATYIIKNLLIKELIQLPKSNGSRGIDGSRGSNGSRGSDGSHGSCGSDGSHGSRGSDGSHGSRGSDDSHGSHGCKGPHGSHGEKGSHGSRGSHGSNGSRGNNR
ncbi:collagen-like protein [Paenibacillus albus]|uniref:Collagen-like protein n=1 Tax=Paenibacillus albus TaxID=2495582 RepID=A0A3S9ADU3_9BACL|nr:collagen-like protein [Paenibacillus albus]